MGTSVAENGSPLPQLGGDVFLTDGGLETTLIFHEGLDLPLFAGFGLLATEEGRARLRAYYDAYARLAREHDVGIVLETATWRASADWGERLGYSPAELDALNRASVDLLVGVREEWATPSTPVVISGCIGPRGDGYAPDTLMTADEASAYHATQIGSFAATEADLVSALTVTYQDEAIGVVRAAAAAGLPAVISFTVETDGRLPNGDAVADAIAAVDTATGGGPTYYMLNCAHPTHFEHVFEAGAAWTSRIRGLRANASTLSHAELDESETLDDGDPADLAARYVALRSRLPELSVLGGCCGTDVRHVRAICEAWLAA